jgi:DNA-directed RNA polymerase specialized sigma24 family protein
LKKSFSPSFSVVSFVPFARYIEDWSYADIADTMQISEGYARVLIHRGLKELKTALEEERPK